MRLDDFDPNAINVEDQRGSGRGGFPMGRGGQVGCGTLVIALILSAVLGVDPGQLIGGMQQGAPQEQAGPAQAGGTDTSSKCRIDAASKESCDTLYSLDQTWSAIFGAANVQFAKPKLVFYSQSGNSGCGAAQSAMGPFYCPEDRGIYLDTDFYQQMDRELGASGQFAREYVIAHEYGHHIQNVLGLSDQVRSAQSQNPRRANELSVRLELQADCYAGVWAAKNKNRLDPGDMQSGMNAAHAIGDDVLMAGAGRRPSPESFTHGSSADRMKWLRTGMETGNEDACDTFADLRRR